MAKILIIDDNKASSAFLKLALLRKRHQVSRSEEVAQAIDQDRTAAPDLVLINQSTRNRSGWRIFNSLQQLAPDVPAMVYVLEALTVPNADWIIKAVEVVIKESNQKRTNRRRRLGVFSNDSCTGNITL